MEKWKLFLHKQNLRTRLITWFLLIALVPFGWIAIISYEICKTILVEQAIRRLEAFNIRQERIIQFYFQERKSEVQSLIPYDTAVEALRPLYESLMRYGKNSVEYERKRQHFYPDLASTLKTSHYQNILLIAKDGHILFSAIPSAAVGENVLTSPDYAYLGLIFNKSRDSLDLEATSLISAENNQLLHIFISVPLTDAQKEWAGTAIIALDTSSLYRFLSESRDMGAFASPLLAVETDHRLIAIAPAGSPQESTQEVDPNSPFGVFIRQLLQQARLEAREEITPQSETEPKLPSNRDRLAIVDPQSFHEAPEYQDLFGHLLVARDVHYRGKTILAAGWQFEQAFNWAFVTKIDENQLLDPIYRFEYLLWILITATVSTVIVAACHVARKISSPILTLTEKTKILAAGDLSQRIEIGSQDEIGRLGQSFNDMAAQLDTLVRHLDDLVEKRTREYERQNVTLEQTIQELHTTQDRLITQEKLASLGALTAGIAHEIKNPLNFINNFSELSVGVIEELKGHLATIAPSIKEAEFQEVLALFDTLALNMEKICSHGKRADSIVRNMLQHSRGASGEKIAVDIHRLLDEYAALAYHGMCAQHPGFHASIEKQYDPSLPLLEVIPQEISRVFLNLLNNAYYSLYQKRKESSTDTAYQPKVSLSTEFSQGAAIIRIRDNGLGIAASILPKLFTPFFTTKPTGEGTGLGLSLSYNMVVQGHGGRLTVASKEGEFAEFTMVLPCRTKSLQ